MRQPAAGGGSGGGDGGAPADPARAAEMDNASIVATLPPELRREVLLSADEALLGTLPPNLVAEAMVLRERIPHQVRCGLHYQHVLLYVLLCGPPGLCIDLWMELVLWKWSTRMPVCALRNAVCTVLVFVVCIYCLLL